MGVICILWLRSVEIMAVLMSSMHLNGLCIKHVLIGFDTGIGRFAVSEIEDSQSTSSLLYTILAEPCSNVSSACGR